MEENVGETLDEATAVALKTAVDVLLLIMTKLETGTYGWAGGR